MSAEDIADRLARAGEDVRRVRGRMKWFDHSKGYGFLVDDLGSGDVLVHASTLSGAGVQNIYSGDTVEGFAVVRKRGPQLILISDHDDSTRSEGDGPRLNHAPQNVSAEWEVLVCKWFNRERGYGFLTSLAAPDDEDVFIHMETLKRWGVMDLQPGQLAEARIGETPFGYAVAEIRPLATFTPKVEVKRKRPAVETTGR